MYIFLCFWISTAKSFIFYFQDFYPNVMTGSKHRSFETVMDSIAIGGIIALIPFGIYQLKLINFKERQFFIFIHYKIKTLSSIILKSDKYNIFIIFRNLIETIQT